jgi:hypothetical protein
MLLAVMTLPDTVLVYGRKLPMNNPASNPWGDVIVVNVPLVYSVLQYMLLVIVTELEPTRGPNVNVDATIFPLCKLDPVIPDVI